MSVYKLLSGIAIFLFTTLSAFSQCFPFEGGSPAFEFNIPSGVTVTSVLVKIDNYSHGGNHYRARIRSFQDLKSVYVNGSGEYEVLSAPISGPSTQDMQIESGLDSFCGYVGDSVSFNWQVIITATGLDGNTINYSGPLTDNLAIPDNVGKVSNGTNLVSGSIDKELTGPGIVVYPDNDYDGFGDASSNPILACSEYCSYFISTNNLDCNDHDPYINPDQQEIPNNGLDDDCDGLIDCADDASFTYAQPSYCKGEDNPVPSISGTTVGTFSSSPELKINNATGEIDLTVSAPGTYTITYTTSGLCTTNKAFEITIIETPVIVGLTVSNITKDGFTVSWNAIQPTANYIVKLYDDPSFSRLEIANATEYTTHAFTSLLPETTYYVEVYADTGCGTGLPTTLSVTTLANPRVTDSLALVALYQTMNGELWTRKDNWLKGPLDTWYGIKLSGQRVTNLQLENNNLKGELPSAINDLLSLNYFNLGDNDIYAIPDSIFYFSGASGYMYNNQLTFEDIVNQPIYFAKLYDQQLVGIDTAIYLNAGDSYTIDLGIDASVPDNQYVWLKNGAAFDTTHVNYYTLSSLTLENEGVYTCQVTNARTQLSESLTLLSEPVTIHVAPPLENPLLTVSEKEICLYEAVTLSATGRHATETFNWSIIDQEGKSIGIPDSLRSAPSLSFPMDIAGKFQARLTLSNPFAIDTVLEENLIVHHFSEIILSDTVYLAVDSLVLMAVNPEQSDIAHLYFTWKKKDEPLGTQNALWVKVAGIYQVEVINSTGCTSHREVVVVDARQLSQTIVFDTIPDMIYGNKAYALSASSSSGLPVSYEVVEGQESVSLREGVLSLIGTGHVTIKATQGGNEYYLAAEPVSQRFVIYTDSIIHVDSLHQLSMQINATDKSFPIELSLYKRQNGEVRLMRQENTFDTNFSFNDLINGEYSIKLSFKGSTFLNTYLGEKLILHEAQWLSLSQDTTISIQAIPTPQNVQKGVTISGVFVQSSTANSSRIELIQNKHTDGTPVVGLSIYLINAQGQKLVVVATTDNEGNFTLLGIAPGTYLIKADYNNLEIDPNSTFVVADKSLDLVIMAEDKIHLVAAIETEDQVTSIEDMEQQGIRFYPNPIEDRLHLTISLELLGSQLEIFNAHGKRVFANRINTTEIDYSLSHLNSGYYQMQIISKEKRYLFKLLKK